jgi:hypothetical protein
MNDYIIEYKKRGDEFSAHERHYVYSSDTETAIKAFRNFFSIEKYEITEVAKVMKKDFSKM